MDTIPKESSVGLVATAFEKGNSTSSTRDYAYPLKTITLPERNQTQNSRTIAQHAVAPDTQLAVDQQGWASSVISRNAGHAGHAKHPGPRRTPGSRVDH